MHRAAYLAAAAGLVAGLAAPAVAEPAASPDTASVHAFTAQLSAMANQSELRRMLAHRGYIVRSDFTRNGSGLWVATASKDGQLVPIAVRMPARVFPTPLTN